MVTLEVSQIQFTDGGNTMWVHGVDGSTTLRIKTTGKFIMERCKDSPCSHADIMLQGDVRVCVGSEVKL
jgi:hypothetical protein